MYLTIFQDASIIDINPKKTGGFGHMSKNAYISSFIIISFLFAGLTVFLLRRYEPVRKTSSVSGKIVKIHGNSIEIRPAKDKTALLFSNLENIGTYQNILRESQRDNIPIEVYFSETYHPFSKKKVWQIDAVSLNFGAAK
jgi:hypothetical protein